MRAQATTQAHDLTLNTKASRSACASCVSASSCCRAPFIIHEELVSPGCTRAAGRQTGKKHVG